PPRREGQRWRLGMNALAHQQVGQGDTCGQYSHPHFTILRLGALFINLPKLIGPAVVSDDDACMSHGPLPPSPAAPQSIVGGKRLLDGKLPMLPLHVWVYLISDTERRRIIARRFD